MNISESADHGRTSATELLALTEQLRALRLPDEAAVILEVGSVRCRECGPRGAIRVTASKHGHTETVEALYLEDALLMVRARLDETIKQEAAAKAEAAAAGKDTQ